jgi:phosphate transport system substrate-binding protein
MAAPVHRRLAKALVFSAASLGLAGCNSPGLSGAGASFPAAIYQRWLQELAGQGTRVNY